MGPNAAGKSNDLSGENTELNTTDETPATFDIVFRSLLPKSKGNILVNLHIDFEIPI